jgi:ferredoxin-type protein NapH
MDSSLPLPTPPLPAVAPSEKRQLTIIGLGLLALLPATFAADAWLAQMSLYVALALVSLGTLLWAAGRGAAGQPVAAQ